MTLTDKAILVVLMVGNTSCYGGECMMMMQSLQSIAIFPPKKTIFPQHSYRDIMDRQQDDDGDAADADADAPSTDKLNGRNARIIQLIKMETIFISINSSNSASR